MSESKHTPGPWEWAKAKSGITFDEEGSVYPPDAEKTSGYQYSGPIAVVSVSSDAGGEANGLLIAAAPDLLDACDKCEQLMLNRGDPFRGDDWQLMQDIRAAITKATGKTFD